MPEKCKILLLVAFCFCAVVLSDARALGPDPKTCKEAAEMCRVDAGRVGESVCTGFRKFAEKHLKVSYYSTPMANICPNNKHELSCNKPKGEYPQFCKDYVDKSADCKSCRIFVCNMTLDVCKQKYKD
jgi:hypothetical protein